MIRKYLFFLLTALWFMTGSATFKGFTFEDFSKQFKNFSKEEKQKFIMGSAIKGGVLFTARYRRQHPYIIDVATTALNNGAGLGIYLVSGAAYYKFKNEFTEKLLDSSLNGTVYNNHYNDFFLNLKKDNNISSVSLRQMCYVPMDMAVSAGLDKVVALEAVKIVTNNISAKNKRFFKKHLTIATSAVALDTLERLTRKDYSSTYNKPMEALLLNHILTEGVIEFLDLDFTSRAMIGMGIRMYVTPYIMQTLKGMFG